MDAEDPKFLTISLNYNRLLEALADQPADRLRLRSLAEQLAESASAFAEYAMDDGHRSYLILEDDE